MAWRKRLAKDIAELTACGHKIIPEEGTEVQLECFRVTVAGPPDSPYAGGQWHVRLTISTEFPFKSPSVGFVERILHPNVDWSAGAVCLDALNKNWSPTFTLRHIIEDLLPMLLANPNPDDPLNHDAAALLRRSRDEFNAEAKRTTLRYASCI